MRDIPRCLSFLYDIHAMPKVKPDVIGYLMIYSVLLDLESKSMLDTSNQSYIDYLEPMHNNHYLCIVIAPDTLAGCSTDFSY